MKTFSVGFAEAGASNELADARTVAALSAPTTTSSSSHSTTGPVTSTSSSGTSTSRSPTSRRSASIALSELAAEHVTVALSGQGADELLGGYRKHRARSLAEARGSGFRVPPRRALLAAARRARAPAPAASRRSPAPDPAERLLAMSGHMPPELRGGSSCGPLAELDGDAGARRDRVRDSAACRDGHRSPTTLYLDAQLALVDDMLHYFDRASMAHSLEVRVPFLDHELVEFCARDPDRLKVRRLRDEARPEGGGARPRPGRDHRQAEDRLLPSRGRRVAADPAHARSAGEVLLAGCAALCRVPRSGGAVEPWLSGFLDGERTSTSTCVVAILMLEVWLETYLPRASAGRKPPAVPYEAVP